MQNTYIFQSNFIASTTIFILISSEKLIDCEFYLYYSFLIICASLAMAILLSIKEFKDVPLYKYIMLIIVSANSTQVECGGSFQWPKCSGAVCPFWQSGNCHPSPVKGQYEKI